MSWGRTRDELDAELANEAEYVKDAAEKLSLPLWALRDAFHEGARVQFEIRHGYRAGTAAVRLATLAAAANHAITEEQDRA